MSASDAIKTINNNLEPVLFQVIGSTPESIAESISKTNSENNVEIGVSLASISIFAAAVNKPTVEAFIARPEFMSVRVVIQNFFSVSSKTNMTAISLLGHCLLTSGIVDPIVFAAQLRKKMGQSHIWAGALEAGSLSDKQKKILSDRQKLVKVESAKLLGSGFFKYFGIDTAPWTAAENAFWKRTASSQAPIPATPAIKRTTPAQTARQTTASGSRTSPSSSSAGAPEYYAVTLTNGETVNVDAQAYSYYLAVNENNINYMVASIERRGIDNFNAEYRKMSAADPERRGRSGNTVVG